MSVEVDNLVTEMMENLDAFVLDPAPQGALVKCRITRDRKGMDRGEYILADQDRYLLKIVLILISFLKFSKSQLF